MAKEKSLWVWLARANIILGEALHMRRVENLVGEGDPDVEGCYLGGAFNIELKACSRPARDTTRCIGPADIRPGQVPFARMRWKAGGQSYFLIAVGHAHQAQRYLIPGIHANNIIGASELGLQAISITEGGVSAVDVIKRAASFRSPVDPTDL
jgi:hypothetical protein